MNENEAKLSDTEPAYVIDLDTIPQPQLTGHQWRQQGNLLICQSCPFTHGTHIASNYQLYGIDDDGNPLIRELRRS